MSAGIKQPSAPNCDDKPAKAADSGQPAAPQTNFERLIAHLPKDSLAAKLVTVYAAASESTPADAVAKVAAGRLDELKCSYD